MSRLWIGLFVAGFMFARPVSAFDASTILPATGTIEFSFTPGSDAGALIVRTIDAAQSQILVQAYSFTHRDIADALVRAHRRGIMVELVADRDQSESFESSAMQYLLRSGVPVFLDGDHSSAHNKVIVIDHTETRSTVVTGSFNFTFAAQNRNAENVLVLHGNPELTQAYYENWLVHREHAVRVAIERAR